MKSGRKGQIFGGGMMFMIFGMAMIFFFMFYMMQFGGMMNFMRDYDEYPQAWSDYIDDAFGEGEDRTWRALTLFGLPFLFYFSAIQLSLTFIFSGAAAKFGYFSFKNIQRPLMVVCFTVAFLMLPGPMTYTLSGLFMMLSPILAIAIGILAMMGLFLVWTFVNKQMEETGVGAGAGYYPTEREREKEREKEERRSRGEIEIESTIIHGLGRIRDRLKNKSYA